MKNSATKILPILCLILFNVFTDWAQTNAPTKNLPENWSCDARWTDSDSIYVGTVTGISPVDESQIDKQTSANEVAMSPAGLTAVNVVRFSIEKSYKGGKNQPELEIYNFRTAELPAINFKVGKKYLIYLDSHGYGESFGKGGYSKHLDYLSPDSRTKSYSEATEIIAFLEKVYQLESPKDVLGYQGNDVISGGVIGGKATNLVKPPYPAEAKKDKAGGAVHVQVLIDESGKIIKAKAVCASHPALGKAAEAAALASSFSPTMLSGKPVKVRGVIVYNFVP